jgi:hypothetical protein
MEYVPPYGRETEGDTASYVNGDPSIGRQGSIPPANAFEHPMREIVHVIEKNQIVPDANDLYQLLKATRSQRANYVQDTGSANNLSVALDPPLAAYTLGLVLHVRIGTTNTGASRINAGAGVVPIRKMSGADTSANDLPAGALATLIYDGSVFQLSNFGGAGGGAGDVFEVKIPYCVDTSTTPGIITANFSPAITALAAGDEIAVKIANTAPGPTVINVNGLPAIHCQPNGGGPMLQGDMHAGNIVIFFYDGNYLYFQPDPQIDAAVTYTIGAGQNFPDVNTALGVLRRKNISANGSVTLKMIAGIFSGNIDISHQNGDRITIAGTMIGAYPVWSDFAATGNDAAHRANDANYNIAMLRSRFGTEIQVPQTPPQNGNHGFANLGAGMPVVTSVLITGNQLPPAAPGVTQTQIGVFTGNTAEAIYLDNVSIWGCQVGVWASGNVAHHQLFITGSTDMGVHCGGGQFNSQGVDNAGGVFGSGSYNINLAFGELGLGGHHVLCAGDVGVRAYDGASAFIAGGSVLNNKNWDLYSYSGSSIFCISGANFGTCSPAVNTVGNVGSVITNV